MFTITTVNATEVLTAELQAQGRAGVPFLNWRIVARKASDLAHFSDAFVGAGLYALCFDDAAIYVGSFLGSGKNGAFLTGDLVTARLWQHVGAITVRGHRVHIARKSLQTLVKQLGADHPMVSGFLASDQPELLHTDEGDLAPLRRLMFAAARWDDFSNSQPEELLKRFTISYVRFNQMPPAMSAADLKQHISQAEKRLIRLFAPKCNGTHVKANQAAIELSCNDITAELMNALSNVKPQH